jgi:hypothetical protein
MSQHDDVMLELLPESQHDAVTLEFLVTPSVMSLTGTHA